MKLDFNGRLQDLTILDLSEKDMPGTNTLAYLPHHQLVIFKNNIDNRSIFEIWHPKGQFTCMRHIALHHNIIITTLAILLNFCNRCKMSHRNTSLATLSRTFSFIKTPHFNDAPNFI